MKSCWRPGLASPWSSRLYWPSCQGNVSATWTSESSSQITICVRSYTSIRGWTCGRSGQKTPPTQSGKQNQGWAHGNVESKTGWVFVTPHTGACSGRCVSSLRSTETGKTSQTLSTGTGLSSEPPQLHRLQVRPPPGNEVQKGWPSCCQDFCVRG